MGLLGAGEAGDDDVLGAGGAGALGAAPGPGELLAAGGGGAGALDLVARVLEAMADTPVLCSTGFKRDFKSSFVTFAVVEEDELLLAAT